MFWILVKLKDSIITKTPEFYENALLFNNVYDTIHSKKVPLCFGRGTDPHNNESSAMLNSGNEMLSHIRSLFHIRTLTYHFYI